MGWAAGAEATPGLAAGPAREGAEEEVVGCSAAEVEAAEAAE